MKLSSLSAFIAAVETGSIRAAARLRQASQPALSKLLKDLEQELGTTLLVRTVSGVVPTAQGRVLYARASAAQRELTTAAEEIRQLSGRMSGEITVSAVPYAVMFLIPEALRTFSRECPDIQLRVSEELYVESLTGLRRGELDMTVGPIPANLPTGEFAIEELAAVRMVVVVREGSHYVKARKLQDLLKLRWIYTGVAGQATSYASKLFAHHGLDQPQAAAVVNSTLGLISIMMSGDYVCLMPEPFAAHPALRAYLSVVPVEATLLDLKVGLIVKHENMLRPSIRQFVNHLHRAASKT